MQGIILAAGRGSRLQKLTEDRPKCLVELAGHPLLSWQLSAMRQAGLEKITVVTGYMSTMIAGDFDQLYNPHWQQTNMVGSLLCAKHILKQEPCLVSYSDLVYGPDAVKTLLASEAELALLYDLYWLELWKKRFADPLIDAESFKVDQNKMVLDIGRKNVPLEEIQGQYMGLLKFTPAALTWIEEVLAEDESFSGKLDMTKLLSLLIGKGFPVTGVPWQGSWCEVDDESDLKVAAELVQKGQLAFPGQ